jgi:hypothetical protein
MDAECREWLSRCGVQKRCNVLVTLVECCDPGCRICLVLIYLCLSTSIVYGNCAISVNLDGGIITKNYGRM